jgi:hypothetical protein
MADIDIPVTPDVPCNDDDDPDPIDLGRLDASLDYLGLCWGEPDTADASHGAGR